MKLRAKVPPTMYEVIQTPWGVAFKRMAPQTDELYYFKNSVIDEALKEIDKFWGLKEKYEKLGFTHNRRGRAAVERLRDAINSA